MKKIEVNGYTLFYSVDYDCDEAGCSCEWTKFFLKTKSVKRRKYWIFGRWIIYDIGDPKSFVFNINFSIYDKRYTKVEVRNAIEHQIELWKRPQEIKKGELI